MATGIPFTVTALLAEVSRVLERAAYERVSADRAGTWPASGARVYEDPYSVAALIAFETWSDLAANWLSAQAALVELMSTHLSRSDAKAWEGYLVLLTPSVLPSDARLEAADIRRNTTHVRKLLATGEELRNVDDVEQALLPLLPLPSTGGLTEERSALDLLPELVAHRGLSEQAVRTAIEAFLQQQSVVERLHALLHNEVADAQ